MIININIIIIIIVIIVLITNQIRCIQFMKTYFVEIYKYKNLRNQNTKTMLS